jgi:hypothetical protein
VIEIGLMEVLDVKLVKIKLGTGVLKKNENAAHEDDPVGVDVLKHLVHDGVDDLFIAS